MRLTELNPNWVGHGGYGVKEANGNDVPRREAVGVSFDCPCGCGTRCFIGFENPADGLGPYTRHDPLWARSGDTFENLTLAPSIQRADPNGCRWHGFIENGASRNA